MTHTTPSHGNIVRHECANGLRIRILPVEAYDSATVMVGVRAGAIDEDLARNYGVAHLLEHLFFKGGKRFPSAQAVARTLEAVGGVTNAFTSYHITAYHVRLPAQAVSTAVEVLSDMLLDARLDPEEIERERKVVLEEIGHYEDDPVARAYEVAREAAYGYQPYGGTIIGTRDSVQSLGRDDLVAFREAHYHPLTTVVGVAGGIAADEVIKVFERWFGGWQPKTSPHTTHLPPLQPHTPTPVVVAHQRRELAQAHLVVGMRIPIPYDDERYRSLSAAVEAVGGMFSSRLNMRIREERGLAYVVRSSVEIGHEDSYVTTYVGTSPSTLSEVVRLIVDEFRSIADEGLTTEEVQVAVRAVAGRTALREESTFARILEVVERTLVGVPELTLHEEYGHFLRLDPQSVVDTARLLARQPVVLSVVSPDEPAAVRDQLMPFISS